MDYEIINKKEWATNLYDCDTESCFLSCLVPCHVYSKLKIKSKNKSYYCVHLFFYMFLYLSIQQLWYSSNYVTTHTCPHLLIDNCINSLKCEDNYMLVDDVPTSCVMQNDFCVFDKYECISKKQSNTTSMYILIFTLFSYTCLTCMHYKVREHIKKIYQINGNIAEDVFAVTCCSTCGLAQEYREL
jgi:Cys-rich protein (TIGR01571 family)